MFCYYFYVFYSTYTHTYIHIPGQFFDPLYHACTQHGFQCLSAILTLINFDNANHIWLFVRYSHQW